MSRRTRIAIASAALAGIIASIVVATALGNREPLDSGEVLLAELERCAETGEQIRQQCLGDLIVRAADAGMYLPLSMALGELGDRDGRLRGDCHAASHKAGRRLISIYEERGRSAGEPVDMVTATVAALTDLDTEVCGSSVAHGLAEAFAAQPQALESWRTLLRGCDIIQATRPGAETGCAHGVGHALVIATTKAPTDAALSGAPVDKLITFCEENTTGHISGNLQVSGNLQETAVRSTSLERVKLDCAYGVMMGTFAPATEPMVKLTAPDELVSHCRTAVEKATREGCFGGAGYALGMNLSMLDKTTDVLSEMLHACDDGGNPHGAVDLELVDICREQVLLHIRSNISEGEGEFAEVVAARCTNLDANFGHDQAVSCIAGLKMAEGSASFDEIVEQAGALGREAERSLQGQ